MKKEEIYNELLTSIVLDERFDEFRFLSRESQNIILDILMFNIRNITIKIKIEDFIDVYKYRILELIEKWREIEKEQEERGDL